MASLITPDTTKTLATRAVKDVYAVSRLVREARVTLEGSFPLLWVEGEISNLAMPASGHIYFSIKDEVAQVRCAMFRNRNRQLRFTPKNGMQVLMRVRVTLYEGRGEFQLAVEHMEEVGSGALQRAYEALKFRLGDEGLFDQAHKKTLPILPKTIGVVSSPSGAAVHDILTVLKRRFSAVEVILYPVAVQGGDSAAQIAEAIKLADERQECDLLIVGRGGGSIEDLWSFNDEKVARTIFNCSLPIISAVGHEVDFTIADFVADIRAATPSAAAELAVPDADELLKTVQSYQRRLEVLLKQRLDSEQRHIKQLVQRLPQPKNQIRQQMQRIDSLERQLSRNWQHIINSKQQSLSYWTMRLKHPQAKIETQRYKLTSLNERLQKLVQFKLKSAGIKQADLFKRFSLVSPLAAINTQQAEVKRMAERLTQVMQQRLEGHHSHLKQQVRTLSAVSPLNTLERGYSITTRPDTGQVVHHADELELEQMVNIRLQTGQLTCEVKEVNK